MDQPLDRFVADSRARLLRTATLLCGDVAAGEDLLQDALLRVSQRWQGIEDNPEGYTRRVLATMATDRWRRRVRRPESLRGELSATLANRAATTPDQPDDRIVLLAAVRRLPHRQRAVVVLRYYADLTEAETAELLGISVSSVKQHARRAARSLRRLLADDFPELATTPGADIA